MQTNVFDATSEFADIDPKVIPFPIRPAARARATPGRKGDERLAQALDDLNNAVLTQRIAMAAWRAALADLGTVTKRLGSSLRGYDDSLTALDTRLDRLRTEAKQLRALADQATKTGG